MVDMSILGLRSVFVRGFCFGGIGITARSTSPRVTDGQQCAPRAERALDSSGDVSDDIMLLSNSNAI
jgi:hypothetical protein